MTGNRDAADRASNTYASAAFDVMHAECTNVRGETLAMLQARAAILRAFAALHRGDRITLDVAVDRFRRCCVAAGIDPDATADGAMEDAA